MPYQIKGNNDFNDGWLAWCLNMPQPENEVGADGWKMAAETVEREIPVLPTAHGGILLALKEMVSRGQIIVTGGEGEERSGPKVTRTGPTSFTVEA